MWGIRGYKQHADTLTAVPGRARKDKRPWRRSRVVGDAGQYTGGGGGGYCLFEGISYPLPNYHPCFSCLFAFLRVFFDHLLCLRLADHHPLKSYFLNAKCYRKVTLMHPISISCNEYHVFYKESENKDILQVTILIRFPCLLSSKELTAPRFWHSPLPLCVAIWQWVAIQYRSAPPPPPPRASIPRDIDPKRGWLSCRKLNPCRNMWRGDLCYGSTGLDPLP